MMIAIQIIRIMIMMMTTMMMMVTPPEGRGLPVGFLKKKTKKENKTNT